MSSVKKNSLEVGQVWSIGVPTLMKQEKAENARRKVQNLYEFKFEDNNEFIITKVSNYSNSIYLKNIRYEFIEFFVKTQSLGKRIS